MAVDFTTVIAVDQAHVEQLEVVAPVWRKLAPEIFERPMVVIYDHQTDVLVCDLAKIIGKEEITFASWPRAGSPAKYATQREKMLTAFVREAPRHVSTPWWLKIDTDALPTRREPAWLDEKWFAPHPETGDPPAFVAPRWGYTKLCYGSPVAFDDWADSYGIGGKRTGIVPEPGAKRVGHARMCSWLSFYNTAWTRWAASLVMFDKLPIPSQDGFHSLLATRFNRHWNKYPAKALGWTNCRKIVNLRRVAGEALAANDH